MRKYTDAKKEGNRKWDAANLDRISIAIPKGQKDLIKAAANQAGQSLNAYVAQAIEERMEREGVGFGILTAPGDGEQYLVGQFHA